MRIGICDDDHIARKKVLEWLDNQQNITLRNIFEFQCGEALLEHLRLSILDIVFLDCKMNGLNGIDTAKIIRKNNSKTVIILLTDFTDYALFGYDADILAYILKKEFLSKVENVFEKAIKQVHENNTKTYAIKTGTGLLQLTIRDILFIESHARKKELVTREGKKYEFYGRINDIELDLRKYGFVRPHNSYLVNSMHIRNFRPDGICLTGYDLPIPVSRGRYKQAYDDMTIYATEVLI